MIAASLRCPTSTGCELGRRGGNAAQPTLDMPSLYGWGRTENEPRGSGREDLRARVLDPLDGPLQRADRLGVGRGHDGEELVVGDGLGSLAEDRPGQRGSGGREVEVAQVSQ